ncbi:MAG: DUF309 domain-containing protein [Actinomycetales bacterium]|nr:DUF309 domain-containing protein [Actinomycetales bacterium]
MTPERNRDHLGRPLPVGEPSTAPPVPGIEGLSDREFWGLGVRLLADGLPFHAHEVFEERWRSCPAEHRVAWRALAQWAAAITHDERGNGVGAQRLAVRALATLDAADTLPDGVNWGLVRSDCARRSS